MFNYALILQLRQAVMEACQLGFNLQAIYLTSINAASFRAKILFFELLSLLSNCKICALTILTTARCRKIAEAGELGLK